MSLLNYLVNKEGGGWLGYRGLYAIIFASPQFGLFAYWVTYTGVTLGAGMFYLTLLPILFGLIITGVLPGRSGITTKNFAIFAIWAVLAYSLYDWARVPMNIFVGVPFWDHWFDWGDSILGGQGYDLYIWKLDHWTHKSHTPRIRVRHGVLHSRKKSDTTVRIYLCFFHDCLLLDRLSCVCPNRCSSALDMVVHRLAVAHGLCRRIVAGA